LWNPPDDHVNPFPHTHTNKPTNQPKKTERGRLICPYPAWAKDPWLLPALPTPLPTHTPLNEQKNVKKEERKRKAWAKAPRWLPCNPPPHTHQQTNKRNVKNERKRKTDLSLPSMGESPMMTEAKADLTCWLASATRSFTHGRMLVMMMFSRTSTDKFWQKSADRQKANLPLNHIRCKNSTGKETQTFRTVLTLQGFHCLYKNNLGAVSTSEELKQVWSQQL